MHRMLIQVRSWGLGFVFTLVILAGAIFTPCAQAQTKAQVTEIQQILTDLGYKPGPVDGAWGKATAGAVRKFAKDRGLRHSDFISQRNKATANISELLRVLENTTETNIRLPISITPQVGHSDSVDSVSISTNGKWFVTGSTDKTRKNWDIASNKLIMTLPHPFTVQSVRFASNDQIIITSSEKIRAWDRASGKLLYTVKDSGVASSPVAVS